MGEPTLPTDAAARLAAAATEFAYPADHLDVLLRYVEAVLAENEHVNLTGAKTLEAALSVLAIDSLPIASAGRRRGGAPRVAVDLGTGNGLPGVAVALAFPACRVLLVERRAKKADAVARCLAAAGVTNAETLAADGRELLKLRPELRLGVDLVTVRAVGDLAPTTREAASWIARGGRIVHWKSGALSAQERAEGLVTAKGLGLVEVADVAFRVPGTESDRRLVIYERPGS